MTKQERVEKLLERCEKGHHLWAYFQGNDIVDPLTFEVEPHMQTCLAFPGGVPQYRGCPICGKRETLTSEWKETEASCCKAKKTHNVEKVSDLMYKGCEHHWHCTQCDDYWPVHCYSKDDLEQMECKASKGDQDESII